MAKSSYIGVGNTAKKVKKMYVGVDGVARKVKKAYIGVKGIAELCFSGEMKYSYNGNALIAGDISGAWEIALLSSGKLSFESLNADSVDVWAISAGGNGKKGVFDFDTNIDEGGAGGDGGRVKFVANVPITEGTVYDITIGQPSTAQGANGGDTTGFGVSTVGGAFKAGTKNPGRGGNRNGQNGVLAFGGDDSLNFPGRLFGASAAAGGSYDIPNYEAYEPGKGGETGAGDGGTAYLGGVHSGTNADPNTGAGGGNGGIGDDTGKFGKGSNGLMLIRPHMG